MAASARYIDMAGQTPGPCSEWCFHQVDSLYDAIPVVMRHI